jgi:hypothetical protein
MRRRLLCSHTKAILLILLLASVCIRLIDVAQPFVDSWSGRQSMVAMIARNFYLHGFDIFYPEVDWTGPSPGYVGSEFPLVPFLASLFYLLFGVQDWVGRSISVLFFALSLPFFFLLVRKACNQRSAYYASAMYVIAPLSIFASRSFTSDMASLSFSLMALYFFIEWVEQPESAALFLATALSTSLAVLLKLPAIIIGVPFVFLAHERFGQAFLRDRRFYFLAAACLILPIAWYVHAYLISISSVTHHFTGEKGLSLLDASEYGKIIRRFATEGVTPPIFVAMVVGASFHCSGTYGRTFHYWLLAMILFVFFAGEGNYRHLWYQLPAVPVAAALAGRAWDLASHRLGSKRLALLVIFFFAGTGYLSYRYIHAFYIPWSEPIVLASTTLNHFAPRDALVVIADGGNPVGLYYSGRRGWHFLPDFGAYPVDSEQAMAELENLRSKGAAYLIFTEYSLWWLDTYLEFAVYVEARYRRIEGMDDFAIFDLSDNSQTPDSDIVH